jgi:hypothetical protein
MKKLLIAAMPFVLCAGMPVAKADETGLASIHDQRFESGRRVCMSEHFHDGTGTGATRKQAEAAARSSWADFTSFEYGSTWASYDLSGSKSMSCSQMGGNQWSCSTSARPCKRAARSEHAARSKNGRAASR